MTRTGRTLWARPVLPMRREDKNVKKTAWLLAVAILLACLLAGCGAQPETPTEEEATPTPRSARTLIGEIIHCYGYEKEPERKLAALFDELDALDGEQGKLWREILDYWRYADEDMPIATERLPDTLPKDDSLCLVVLGYQLHADGSMQPELIGRLETALACARQYPESLILCTGGGTASGDRTATEAGRMAAWLAEQGVDEARLIVEDRSLSTADNALFSRAILLRRYPQVTELAIVTSSYHVPWGAVLFEAAFLQAASRGEREVHVAANCAWPTENELYPADSVRYYQASGLMQMIDA